ncbi:uncharacterized protein VNE69_01184 [Vairimorpha necatrix]|uniref:Uncharacterized protein n=1 Tax=Vairimorpha necatrix TaxID=6039 RepID=A0AAX4J8K7_9MICR
MKILNVIFLFVLVKTRHMLYEKVNNNAMEKLKTGDYMSIDVLSPEKYLAISALFYEDAVRIGMFDGKFKNYNDDNLGNFTIITKNQSAVDIINEMEAKIENLLDVSCYYSIVLVYDTYHRKGYHIMKEFVFELKKMNNERKKKSSLLKINYEKICEASNELQKYISEIFNSTAETSKNTSRFMTCSYLDWQNNRHNVVVSIYNDNICHIMEFCVNEYYHIALAEIDVKINNKQIFEKLHQIYNLCYNSINFYEIKYCSQNYNRSTKKIEMNKNNQCFKIQIETEHILIQIDDMNFFYNIQNDIDADESKFYISKNCYKEFEAFLNILSDHGIDDALYFFYKLVVNYDEIYFIIQNILNRSRSATNIIFCHLLLHKKAIEIDTFNTIINNTEYSEIKAPELIKNIISNIRMSHFDDCLYLITLCLLLETETYINENEFEGNTLFSLLKETGSIIIEKEYNNEAESPLIIPYINVVQIFMKIANVHNYIYEYNKNAVLEYICNIGALFTGLSSINIHYDIIYKNINVKRDQISTKNNIDEKDIIKNNEIITKRLIENTIAKTKENILKGVFSITLIKEKLNHIFKEIMNKYLENNYDEKEKKIIENKVKFEIEKYVNEIEPELLNMNINKDVINEYRNILIDKFMLNLDQYAQEYLKNTSKEMFYSTIIKLFKSEFSDDEKEKIKCQIIFEKLKEILNEKERFDIVNNNEELFYAVTDELKKTLKGFI